MTAPGKWPPTFADDVADAVAHFQDPVYLQTHTLGRFVRPRRLTDSPARAGHALRQEIEATIEQLKPASHTQTGGAPPGSRGYELMRLRYVEGLDPSAAQRRLGLGKSRYYQDHRRAGPHVFVLAFPGEKGLSRQLRHEADRALALAQPDSRWGSAREPLRASRPRRPRAAHDARTSSNGGSSTRTRWCTTC